MTKLKIYGISGLGADQRVFNSLQLNYELAPVAWIEPKEGEPIKDYSLRLSNALDTSSDFAILGVSFGGLVAVEISKLLNPCMTILISTVETRDELRPIYKVMGKLGLLNVLPIKAFDPPRRFAQFAFGTKQKDLLNNILNDIDLKFAKWAVIELARWNNRVRIENVLRIHGTNDKLIPWNSSRPVHLIPDGEHFMIVDRAREISEIINKELKTERV